MSMITAALVATTAVAQVAARKLCCSAWTLTADLLLHFLIVQAGLSQSWADMAAGSLERILGGVSTEELRKWMEEKDFLTAKWDGSQDSSFDLFSMEDVADILTQHRRQFPNDNVSAPIHVTIFKEGLANRAQEFHGLLDLYRTRGYTLALNVLERHHPRLQRITSELMNQLGVLAGINAYLSPPVPRSALPPHVDKTDSIAIQISGSKVWTLCDQNLVAAAALHEIPECNHMFNATSYYMRVSEPQNCRDELMQPGQRLFLRHGVVHWATPHNLQEPSLHLVIGLKNNATNYLTFLRSMLSHDASASRDNLANHLLQSSEMLCNAATAAQFEFLHRPVMQRRQLLAAISFEDAPEPILLEFAKDVHAKLILLRHNGAEMLSLQRATECIEEYIFGRGCHQLRNALDSMIFEWAAHSHPPRSESLELNYVPSAGTASDELTLDTRLYRPFSVHAFYRNDGWLFIDNVAYQIEKELGASWSFAASYWRHGASDSPDQEPRAFAVWEIPALSDEVRLAVANRLVVAGALRIRA